MKVSLLDKKGKKTDKKVDLNDSIFGLEFKEAVITQYLHSYLSNQREGNAHTKDRSEVRGGGRKPWRQKGTGRARFGSTRNPIWRGGGVAFGPTNEVNWSKSLNKKFKKAAMKHSLSKIASLNKVSIIAEVELNNTKPLTKQAEDLLNNIDKEAKKFTIVTEDKNEDLLKASGNLKTVKVVRVADFNPYQALTGGQIILEQKAVSLLEERLTSTKVEKPEPKPKKVTKKVEKKAKK